MDPQLALILNLWRNRIPYTCTSCKYERFLRMQRLTGVCFSQHFSHIYYAPYIHVPPHECHLHQNIFMIHLESIINQICTIYTHRNTEHK